MFLRMEKTEVMQFMKEFRVKEKRATTRMGHLPVEGGGLNASYTTVDAVANICATAGNIGLMYGKDFIWSHTDYDDDDDDCVTLLVKDEKYKTFLHLALQNNHRIKHTDTGKIKLIKERK